MMPARDITGQRFGAVSVLHRAGVNQRNRAAWVCRCDCGSAFTTDGTRLRTGKVKSCGCMKNVSRPTHGQRNTPTYVSWQSMKQRCHLPPTHKDYSRYAGRGIAYDPRWESFTAFVEDMGERPIGKTLDRIDNALGYFKDNCRWATAAEQAMNRDKRVTRAKEVFRA